MNVFLSSFREFKKVIDIGADIPAVPWKIPPKKPKGKKRFFDL